jgi:integrase
MKLKLTKTAVESVQPGARDLIIYDSALRGFFLRVTPKGKRAYGLYYRTTEGRERRPMLGAHGPAFTAEQARRKAESWLGLVANGGDPSADKQAKRQGATIAELCEIYLEQHAKTTKKVGTYDIDYRNIHNHIIPLIGKLKVASIQQADIEQCISDIAGGKTAKTEVLGPRKIRKVVGGKGAASRCLTTLSHMLGAFAESRKIRPLGSNPCQHVKRPETQYSRNGRERFLSPKEFARLGEVLEQIKIDNTEPLAVVNAIELYLFTGCRRDEVLTLQWAHVDLANACLRLPDSKTGSKIVSLGAPAIAVLESIKRKEKNPYVITGSKEGGHFVGIQKPWRRIRKRAAINDVTIHDLRRSFGSVGAQGGMSLLMVGKALAHKSNRATAVYARLTDDLTRQAVQTISDEVANLLKGSGEVEPAANV